MAVHVGPSFQAGVPMKKRMGERQTWRGPETFNMNWHPNGTSIA
jgi:hypothetical protein